MQAMTWIKYVVKEKSKHFLALSTCMYQMNVYVKTVFTRCMPKRTAEGRHSLLTMNAIETAVTTAAPKLDSTTIQPPTFSQALLKMYERVSLPAYGPATSVRMTADSADAAVAQSRVSVLTYQDP